MTDIESTSEQSPAPAPTTSAFTRPRRAARAAAIAAVATVMPFGVLTVTSLLYGWPVTVFTTEEFDGAAVPAEFREPIARGALACSDLLGTTEHAAVLAARIDGLSGFDTAALYPAVQAQTPPAPTEAIGGGTVRSVGEATRLLAVQDCEAADRADTLIGSGRIDGDIVPVALSIAVCGDEPTRTGGVCTHARQILDTAHQSYTHTVRLRPSPVP